MVEHLFKAPKYTKVGYGIAKVVDKKLMFYPPGITFGEKTLTSHLPNAKRFIKKDNAYKYARDLGIEDYSIIRIFVSYEATVIERRDR